MSGSCVSASREARRWREVGETRHGTPPATPEALLERWRQELGTLHPSNRMIAGLDAVFDCESLQWTPYLCAEIGDADGIALERTAIAAGDIQPLGFLYVGTLDEL